MTRQIRIESWPCGLRVAAESPVQHVCKPSEKLAGQYSGHAAAQWLGHAEEIANAHYRQVLPEHFEKAQTTQIVMPNLIVEGVIAKKQAANGSHRP